MSRIGKRPISLPPEVKVEQKEDILTVSGPKGQVQKQVHSDITVSLNDRMLAIAVREENKGSSAFMGSTEH